MAAEARGRAAFFDVRAGRGDPKKVPRHVKPAETTAEKAEAGRNARAFEAAAQTILSAANAEGF